MHHSVGDLAEVLDNLGVFAMHPEELLALCPSGFRRVPISQGDEHYLSLQGFTANQTAYAHTHPDSEEWVIVLSGQGQALLADNPVPLERSLVIGRARRPTPSTASPEAPAAVATAAADTARTSGPPASCARTADSSSDQDEAAADRSSASCARLANCLRSAR